MFRADADHPLATGRKNRLLERYGIELIYGQDAASILGAYDKAGDRYQINKR